MISSVWESGFVTPDPYVAAILEILKSSALPVLKISVNEWNWPLEYCPQ